MKNFLKEYFYVAKHDRIKDNVFTFRIFFSVAVILICMFAMGFAAYGFFTSDLSVQQNSISSARYSLNIKGIVGMVSPFQDSNEASSIEEAETVEPTAPTDILIKVPGSVAQYKLTSGDYTFILEKQVGPDLASTGYCKIVFDGKHQPENADVNYTKQIGKISPNESKTFRYVHISVSEETIVDFVPSWGTYSGEGFDETETQLSPKSQQTTQNEPPEEENGAGEENDQNSEQTLPETEPVLTEKDEIEEEILEETQE